MQSEETVAQSEEEPQPQPESEPESVPEISPRQQESVEFYAKLNKVANDKAEKFFEFLTTTDEYTNNGQTYKYKIVNRKNMGELRKLIREGGKLSEKEDFEAYSDNIMKRACILIQDMTPEKFDAEDSDYELLEDLVGAWSIKYRGFRDFEQGVQ